MIRNSKRFAARTSTQNQRRPARNYRRRILARFRALGHGVDARTARLNTFAFYRSSGAVWARGLI